MAAVTVGAVAIDTSELERRIRTIRADQAPFALSLALNDLMWDTIKAEQREMQQSFDRPTPFVLRGLRIAKKATKRDPNGAIWFKDVFGRFGEAVENTLRPQIEGGERNTKSTENRLRQIGVLGSNEYLVPGGSVRLNRYGNVTGAQHVKALSYLRAFWEAGYSGNRRAGASTNRAGERYFVNRAGGNRAIYRVRGRGRPQLIFYITSRPPRYRERFDFYGEANRNAARRGAEIAQRAIDRTLASAR